MHERERTFFMHACKTTSVPAEVDAMYKRVRKTYNRGVQGFLHEAVLALIVVLSGWDEKVDEAIELAREEAKAKQAEKDKINPGDPVTVLDPETEMERQGVFHSERKDRKYNVAFEGDEKKYRVVERRHVLKNV